MDVVTVDAEGYFATGLVEGLTTKIWTERYSDFGEFEFHSNRVAETMELLPEGSLISLRDSDVIMMVEDHNIVPDGDNGQKIIVKGRACECILQARAWAGAKYGKKPKMRQKYSIQNAIMVYMVNLLANYTNTDYVSKSAPHPPAEGNNIPNLRVTDGTITPLKAKDRYVENSNAWTYIQTMLNAGKFGIRSIKPNPSAPARKTVHVSISGVVSKPLETTDGITFEIYEGLDRTTTQAVVPPVVFSVATNSVTEPEYLFSSKLYRSVGLVISGSGPTGGKEVERLWEGEGGVRVGPTPRGPRGSTTGVVEGIAIGEPPPSGTALPNIDGWNRREELIDAGTKDDDDTTAEFLASLDDIGSDTLKAEFDRITSVEGAISSTSEFKYKIDYDLGDRVTLQGQFNLEKNMVVQEYVRTEDKDGERGFPTLILWT